MIGRRYLVWAHQATGVHSVVARAWTERGARRARTRIELADLPIPRRGSAWVTTYSVQRRRRVWDGRINAAGIPAAGSVTTTYERVA